MAGWENWDQVGREKYLSGNQWNGLRGPIVVGIIFTAGGMTCTAVGAWLYHRAQSSSQANLESIGPWFVERGGAVALVFGVLLLVCVGIVRMLRNHR